MHPVKTQALLCAFVVVACGASPTPNGNVSPPKQDEWAGLSWEERHDVMTFAVLPNMARTFQRFRASPNPDLTCVGCHGADAEKTLYKMPNKLPALDPAKMPDPNAPGEDGRMAKFMTEEVTPEISELLGKRATCFTCHPNARGAR